MISCIRPPDNEPGKGCAWPCYPLSCFSLGSFTGPPGKRDYSENFQSGSWHHNTGIPTGLARLSYNRKVDFCCVKLRCRDLCKASLPGSCTQAPSCIVRLVHHSARLVHRRTNIRSHSALFNYLLRSTKGCDNWKRAAYLQGSFFILENSYHQGDICLQNNEKWNITAAWLDQLGECRSCWAGGRGSNLGWTNTQGLWITEKKVLPL